MPLDQATVRVIAQEALDWLQQLRDDIATDKAQQRAEVLAQDEYDASEYVARIVVADKARALLRAVSKAVRSGEVPRAWDRGDLPQRLVTTGLGHYDPRIAFQASLRSAYSAGRYQRGMQDEQAMYWLYRTMRDSRVRDTHKVLNGVLLPKGDGWWAQHYPPNGWRCRCKAIALSGADAEHLKARGVQLQEAAPKEEQVEHVNAATGERETLPASLEPGWGFNPGTPAGRKQLGKLLQQRMKVLQEAPEDAL